MVSTPYRDDLESSEARDVKDLARGGLITFAGKICRVSRGGFLWVVTLLMGLDVQGLYSLSWGIVSTLNKIARFGMLRGVVRFVVAGRAKGDDEQVEGAIATALGIVLVCSAAVTLLILLSADAIAAFYDKPIARALRIMAFSAPFMATTWVFVSAIRALRIVLYGVYVMSIAGPLILLLGGVVAGLMGTGLEGVAWVQLLMAVGSSFLAAFFFRRFFSLRGCFSRIGRGASWKQMIRFSFPVMGTDLLYAVLTQLDVLMLGFFVSGEMVGVYALARRIASVMLKAPQAFDPIFSSIVSELALEHKVAELNNRFKTLFRWVLTINLPIFAVLLIVGDQFLALMGGERMQVLPEAEIAAGLKVLFVLSLSMMVQGTFALAEPLLAMAGRPQLNFFNNGLWLLSNFAANIWFIQYQGFGILGAALGALLASGLVNGVRLYQIYYFYDIKPFGISQLKPIVSALGASLASWLASTAVASVLWSMVAAPLVFAPVYLVLLRLMGVEPEDRVLIDRAGNFLRRWTRST